MGSVNVEKVSDLKIRENYAALLGEIAPKKIDEVVAGLEAHFAKEPDTVQCDVCLGFSTPDLDKCPYCDVGEEEPVVVQAEIVGDDVAIDASAIEASGIDLEPETKGKRKKLASGSTEHGATEIAEQKMVRRAPSTPKPSAPVLALAGGRRSAGSETELDASLARFRAAGETGAVANYVMGVELARMRDHLWQQRAGEDGKPKYKTWNQFVAGEVEFTTGFANRLMRVVENFEQGVFERLGSKALMIIVGAPKEDHAALIAKAEEGATTRDLDEEVKRIREQKGIAVIDAEGKPGRSPTSSATAASAKARKKEAAAITVGLKAEQVTLKAMARVKRGEPDRAAKTIEDQPYAVLECLNDVKIFVVLKMRPTGELEFKITAKRDKDE